MLFHIKEGKKKYVQRIFEYHCTLILPANSHLRGICEHQLLQYGRPAGQVDHSVQQPRHTLLPFVDDVEYLHHQPVQRQHEHNEPAEDQFHPRDHDVSGASRTEQRYQQHVLAHERHQRVDIPEQFYSHAVELEPQFAAHSDIQGLFDLRYNVYIRSNTNERRDLRHQKADEQHEQRRVDLQCKWVKRTHVRVREAEAVPLH